MPTDDDGDRDRDRDRDCDLDTMVADLHRHLEATAELPIDPRTNRWLGEAEAIAVDVASSDLDRETIHERVEKIQHLLSEVDTTGNDEADGYVDAAMQCCRAILED